MKDWKVIVSKLSGGGKAGQAWARVSELLTAKGVTYSESFTEYKYHAIELTKEALKAGYRKILTLGGDGAIHEILNGVMTQSEVPTQEVTIAMIPVGSGNDWPRYHQIPLKDLDAAVEVIVRGKEMIQDVVKVETINNGNPYTRYMVNIGGLGFDAQVCHLFEAAKKKGKSGDAQYYKCLMQGFMWYKCPHFTVKVDGEHFYEGPAFSVAIGNGRYCGGGMMETPQAIIDDGLLDVTVVKKLWKGKFLFSVKRLFKGTILEMKEVIAARAKHTIEIDATPASFMEVDGEPVGCSPAKCTLIPAAVKVVTNL
ncbi:MAG: diacylglycerol kinase family lipid kinase [Bacteroidales bacterium]|nr:diacylglycerol kinase family lipid kinase [Bacteroidales bacterium]